jgi:prophage DNA circulation protein
MPYDKTGTGDFPAKDLFAELHAAAWRDIEFPVTRARMSVAHDLVEHKAWGVDGAHVESTGLAPLRFSFSSPMLNTITPGRNEKWAALYPNQMRALLAAFQQKSAGMLTHIEFGPVLCKAERMEIDWDAGRRGGVDVELSFVQTTTADEEIVNETPVQVVDAAVENLESLKLDLKALLLKAGLALPPYLQTPPKADLEDAMNKVKAVSDTVTTTAARAAGKVNAVVYQANRIAESASAARSALTWPVIQNCERIKAAAYELDQKLAQQNKQIAKYTVPGDTTLAGIACQIPGAKMGDLIKLNPGLMMSPEIPKGTVVRYYK